MIILVIDAQGGGIGRQLVSSIKQALPNAEILAVGTNAAATAAMLITAVSYPGLGCQKGEFSNAHRHIAQKLTLSNCF